MHKKQSPKKGMEWMQQYTVCLVCTVLYSVYCILQYTYQTYCIPFHPLHPIGRLRFNAEIQFIFGTVHARDQNPTSVASIILLSPPNTMLKVECHEISQPSTFKVNQENTSDIF